MSRPGNIFNTITHDNNMNVVRYYLSFSVLMAHVSVLTGVNMPTLQSVNASVGCFFALSGFLMFPSFQRHSQLKGFFVRRLRKLMPAYAFIVVAAALLLSLVSTLSLHEYFSSSGLYEYLVANLAFLNFLHPDLPGVFCGSEFATDAVNGSLWTMKGEVVCYITVPLVYRLVERLGKRNGAVLLLVVIAAGIAVRLTLLSLTDDEHSACAMAARQFGTVFVFFYTGALINILWQRFIRYKWVVLVGTVLIYLILGDTYVYHAVLQPFVVSSLVLWLSLVGRWGVGLSRHDEVSYDIYLFHFPIIQVAVYLGLPSALGPAELLAVVTLATVALAFFSRKVICRRFI